VFPKVIAYGFHFTKWCFGTVFRWGTRTRT
jgi:hypothetical protein